MMFQEAPPRALYPVILAVPGAIAAWKGRRHVQALSRLARAAARRSAHRSGGTLGRLEQDRDGVPLPSNGWHWSVAHKPSYVAGVVGPGPLGIDIEPLCRRAPGLMAKIADREEWRLGDEDEWRLFYRFWTAKEAVLKAVGMGLKGLSDCRVVRIDGALRMTVAYGGRMWTVRQSLRHGHLAAITSGSLPVCWSWPAGAARQR